MKIILTAQLILISFLFSCQKESANPDVPTTVCKLDSIFIDGSGGKVSYTGGNISGANAASGYKSLLTYDNKGQLLKIEAFNPDGGQLSVREMVYDNSGNLIEDIDIFFQPSWMEKDKYTYEYLNGKIWKAKSYYFNEDLNNYQYYGYHVCTWTNDNLTSMADYDTTGVLLNTTTYTYDLTKENTFRKISDFCQLAGGPINGEDLQTAFYISKNIVIKAQEDNFDNRNYGFEYTFNSENDISVIKVIELTNGETEDVQEFFYQCD